MLQNPADYISPLMSVPQVTPQAFSQGIQVGNGLLDARGAGIQQQAMQQQMGQQAVAFQQAQEDRARALAAAQVAKQQQLAMQAELEALSKNPTTEGFQALMTKHPSVAENLKKPFEALEKKEKTDLLQLGTGATSALMRGEGAIAATMLREAADANEAKGRAPQAEAFRKLAEAAEKSPKEAQARLQAMVIANGGEEAVKALVASESAQSSIAKAAADAKTAKAEADTALQDRLSKIALTKANTANLYNGIKISARKMALDEKELAEKVEARLAAAKAKSDELTDKQEGELTATVLAATASKMNAEGFSDLAKRYKESQAGDSGVVGTLQTPLMNTGIGAQALEKVAEVAGTSTADTALRQDYLRRVDADIEQKAKISGNKLTDTDYAEKRKLYPKATGDKKLVIDWLETEAKKAETTAKIDNARAEWMEQNAGTGPAKKDIVVDGIMVKKGTPLREIIDDIQAVSAGHPPALKKQAEREADSLFGVTQ